MTRLLLAAAALVTAFTVAAGSRSAPAVEPPSLCKSDPDGGRPVPHGLLMVADRADRLQELPCMQGG